VKPVTVRIISVVSQLGTECYATDRSADPMPASILYVNQFNFKPAWKSFTLR